MTYIEAPIDPGSPDGRNPSIDHAISSGGEPELGKVYQVPARQGRAVKVRVGQVLTIVNTYGSQVCDFWAFLDADLREYISMPHQHAVNSGIYPSVGDVIVSNKRRPLLRFIEDTSAGVHDTIVAACDIYRYRQLGVTGYHDNCSDNLRMSLIAIGKRALELPPPFNLWMNTPVIEGGEVDWLPPVSKAGDRVSFRAEFDVIAVLSACPQDLVPINGADNTPRDISFVIQPQDKLA
jgi:uncharacterized protein